MGCGASTQDVADTKENKANDKNNKKNNTSTANDPKSQQQQQQNLTASLGTNKSANATINADYTESRYDEFSKGQISPQQSGKRERVDVSSPTNQAGSSSYGQSSNKNIIEAFNNNSAAASQVGNNNNNKNESAGAVSDNSGKYEVGGGGGPTSPKNGSSTATLPAAKHEEKPSSSQEAFCSSHNQTKGTNLPPPLTKSILQEQQSSSTTPIDRKTALRNVRNTLMEDEIQRILYNFVLCDKNGDGLLDKNELRTAVLSSTNGGFASEESLEKIVDDIIAATDQDKDGKVSIAELRVTFAFDERLLKTNKRFALARVRNKLMEDEINQILVNFILFDKNGDGTLDAQELNNAVKTVLGGHLSSDQVADRIVSDLLAACDDNGDGKVSISELRSTFAFDERNANVKPKEEEQQNEGEKAVIGESGNNNSDKLTNGKLPEHSDQTTTEAKIVNSNISEGASGTSATSSPLQLAHQQQAANTKQQQQRPRIDWETLNEKLPFDKTEPEQKKRRFEMFDEMDTVKIGKLSLEQLTVGLTKVLGVGEIINAPEVIRTAFNTAKLAGQMSGAIAINSTGDADFVEKREFRLLLMYLRQYFELFQLFEEIDEEGDLRISFEEFKKAGPILERWGAKIDDLEKTFKEIDRDGGGSLLFNEMAAWAMAQNLDSPDYD